MYPMVPGYATWAVAGAKLHCSGVRLRYLPVHLTVCGMHCVYLHGRGHGTFNQTAMRLAGSCLSSRL